jgi:hypothetical protein
MDRLAESRRVIMLTVTVGAEVEQACGQIPHWDRLRRCRNCEQQ